MICKKECHVQKFNEEFKQEAVGLMRQPNANVSHVARDIGVGAGILGRWRRELEIDKAEAFSGSGVSRIRSWRP